jgi:acyl carrier protein
MIPSIKIIGYCLGLAILGVLWFYLIRSVVRMSGRSSAVQRRAKEIMRGRRAMSSSEFGSAFFPDHEAGIAARLREVLKVILIVDVCRIHPDDLLMDDLGLGQVDGLDPNVLEFEVQQSFGVNLRPAWPSIKTVRDLVTYVSNHCPVAT